MKIIKNCELCGSEKFRFLFYSFDKNLKIPGKFKINQCKKCGLIFINPQPSFKELEKYYPNERYYSLKKIEIKEKSRKTRLKLFLYGIYFNPKKRNLFLRILFSPIKYMIRGTKMLSKKRLLDIGSGTGQFLYEMKQFDIESYGIEPGEFDKKTSRKYKLNIKNTDLIKANYPFNFFDIITMNHVLEHINNPLRTIKEIHKILKENGLFIVGVPNYNSLAYSIFKKNWHQLDIPRHLFSFSDKLLIKYLKENNFKILKVRYNSRPSQFVVSLFFALNMKNNRILSSLLTIIFLPLTWFVNLTKQGDQVEIWCIKD